ncbi:MAG: hypothetical protein JO218_02275 [Burkholderiales bacterium]|nr:hypothetical protein [Burkholderiales bacterium]
MAISPLSIQQIVAVIRQQMTPPVTLAGTAAAYAGQASRKPRSKTTAARQPARQEALQGLILRRVGALKQDDPDRGRKAFRVFLECVLVNELGDGLVNDPGFYQMVDDIQRDMENDARIAAAMREAIAQLLHQGEAASTP